MQKQIQKSSAPINFLFILALIPWIIACSFMIGKSNASSLDKYCERQFNQSFQYKISPLTFKKCETRFKIITDQWTTGKFINNK